MKSSRLSHFSIGNRSGTTNFTSRGGASYRVALMHGLVNAGRTLVFQLLLTYVARQVAILDGTIALVNQELFS